jgi:hypothetical protein
MFPLYLAYYNVPAKSGYGAMHTACLPAIHPRLLQVVAGYVNGSF